MMDKYFFKIVDNIDFVWKIEMVKKDPYRLDETDLGLFVCNQRQFIPYLLNTIQDIRNRNLLDDYKEIRPQILTEDTYYLDPIIGLLHKDNYWNSLCAVRHIRCLDRFAPVVFGNNIDETDQLIYSRLMSFDPAVGQKVYEVAYAYFKSLWEVDDYFSSTNLVTLESFLQTLQLQSVYIRKDEDADENLVSIHFRPSWDEEHGLTIVVNSESLEVKTNQ